MTPWLIGDLGTPEIVIILAVIMLVFGGSKLPDLARGSGRAVRIFKAEVEGLEEDRSEQTTTSSHSLDDLEARQAAEREALEARHAAERRDRLDH
jgi:sec-independent protein translocase protein TatA